MPFYESLRRSKLSALQISMRARLKWTRVNLMVECLRVPVVHQLVSSFHLVVPPFHSRWQSAHESWSIRRRSCDGGHGGVWSGPVLLFRPQTLGPLKWPGCTFSRGSIQSCGSIVGCEASSRHSALKVCGSIHPTTARKITSRWARLACFGPFCHVKNGPVEGFRHYTEEYWMFGEGIWKKRDERKVAALTRTRVSSESDLLIKISWIKTSNRRL